MGLGLLLVGGLVLTSLGIDRVRRGDRLAGAAAMVGGVVVTVAAVLAIAEWSPLFD